MVSHTMSVESNIPSKTMSSLVKASALGLAMCGLVILVVFVFQSSFSPSFQSQAPADETLDTNFRARRQTFESLLEMSRTDRSVIRIASDFTWLDTDSSWPRAPEKLGFSKERWDQYRGLFREAGVPEGILQDTEGGITYFICWTQGLMTNGSLKGYAYSENKLTPVVTSLDNSASWPKGKRVIFKKLDGNWYLFWMGG